MTNLRAILFACGLCTFFAFGPARADEGAKAETSAAESAYTNLDFPLAKSMSERALSRRGLSHEQLTRATRVLALSNAALDNGDAARDAFVRLLTYEPDFRLDPKLSPRIQEPFAEARGYWKAQAQRPGFEVSTTLRVGSLGALRVVTRDPTEVVARVVVGYRWAPSRDYVLTTLRVGEGQVDVLAGPKSSTRLDYFAQAYDAKDNVVFQEGTSDSPRTAIASAEVVGSSRKEDKSVLASPWFWIVGGAVLAAGGVGTYFALRPGQGDPTGVRVTGLAGCGGGPCN